jgi:hypothetical protein
LKIRKKNPKIKGKKIFHPKRINWFIAIARKCWTKTQIKTNIIIKCFYYKEKKWWYNIKYSYIKRILASLQKKKWQKECFIKIIFAYSAMKKSAKPYCRVFYIITSNLVRLRLLVNQKRRSISFCLKMI